jgi:hypothetical protein
MVAIRQHVEMEARKATRSDTTYRRITTSSITVGMLVDPCRILVAIFDSCNITMTKIESKDLVISQQREEIAHLIRTISTLMDIRKTHNTSCNALNRGEHVLNE